MVDERDPRPDDIEDSMVSREYKLFMEAGKRTPKGFYEKMCVFSEKIIRKKMDEKSSKKMQDAIDFAHLNLTPDGVASFTILFSLLVCIPTFILIATKALGFFGLSLTLAMFVFGVSIPIAYYIYSYPYHLRKKYEMDAGAEIVSSILYMVSYMRTNPSLEGAVDFSAKNLTGSLSEDFRKLMWDVRIGNYLSINEALLDYAEKWSRNKEFVESIELLISSLRQSGNRRLSTLDEAIRVVLEGNRDSARNYIQNLKMPITIIHAMGIILPVMGLVMFPIIAIFLKVDPIMLFLVYDIVLPLVLFFVISNALEKRPATFSRIDISDHPDLPPEGKIYFGTKTINPFYIGLVIGITIMSFGVFLYFNEIAASKPGVLTQGEGVLGGVVIILGLAMIPAIHYLLLSSKRNTIREEVRAIELEFKEALFQLGNVIGTGVPIEKAMDESIKRIDGLKIKNMFMQISNNIKKFGMTFENAIFNKKSGAILYFPSKLIKSVLKSITESSKRGVKTAAISMITISKYLRGIHRTQESVKDSLSEVASSLRFQAYILSPLISGVVSTMAILMIDILKSLALKTPSIGPGGGSGFFGISPENMSISPFQFILVVGIYLFESLILLSYLMNGIENGEDPIGRQNMTAWVLIIGTIAFVVTVYATLTLFKPLVGAVGIN